MLFRVRKCLEVLFTAELIRRLRALTLRLLPVEVDVNTIQDPTSRIITPQVISTYVDAAGDFYNEVGQSNQHPTADLTRPKASLLSS